MIQQSTYSTETHRPVSGESQAEPVGYSERICQYIQEHPTRSVLIGLGVGLGIGLIASGLMNAAGHLSHEDSFAERVGNKVKESLADVVPASWRSHLRM